MGDWVPWITAIGGLGLAGWFGSQWQTALKEKHKAELALKDVSADDSAALQAEIDRLSGELSALRSESPQDADERALDRAEKEIRERLAELEEDADTKAADILTTAMQRVVPECLPEATSLIVPLPNDEVKGRLIGREGRNIRAFEQTTGVDLIIDQTPSSVMLSCFDPERREAARLTLEDLIIDSRIHPQRIEEVHARALKNIDKTKVDAGKTAAAAAGVLDLPKELHSHLGALRFRTSYTQNALDHAVECARLAKLICKELGVDALPSMKASLLHDIGKGIDSLKGETHAIAGMNLVRRYINDESVLNAIGAHHGELTPSGLPAAVVLIVDKLSAARPGARRDSLDQHIKRVQSLEAAAKELAAVKEAYAVQAGRELRVIVDAELADDAEAKKIARQIARKIKQESELPGPVKVTVIREMITEEAVE